MTRLIPFLSVLLIGTSLVGQNVSDDLAAGATYLGNTLVGGLQRTVQDRDNRWIFGTATLATLAAFAIDDRVQTYARENGLLPEGMARFGDHYGGGYAHWVLWATILTGDRLQHTPFSETAKKLTASSLAIFVTGTCTGLLKTATGRTRPNGQNRLSFPSGHTSHSFTVAALLDGLYGHRVGIPAYAVATVVAVSRIHDDKHYLSDVIFGAGLGTIVGRAFSLQYENQFVQINVDGNGGAQIELWVWLD
jgi:membrane-associated phospholipid phosphatase